MVPGLGGNWEARRERSELGGGGGGGTVGNESPTQQLVLPDSLLVSSFCSVDEHP